MYCLLSSGIELSAGPVTIYCIDMLLNPLLHGTCAVLKIDAFVFKVT